MIVLGIDPGYDRCGWAVLQRVGREIHAIGYGCIETNRQDAKLQRLGHICDEVTAILGKVKIDEIAMESLVFGRNVSTALPVSEVRGVIQALAWQNQIPVAEYGPSTIKLTITGYGKADKQQVYALLEKQVKLEKKPKLDDTGDALAVAVTHLVTQPIKPSVKKTL